MSHNHTPIHHLVDDHNKKKEEETTVTITKEGEPIKISSEAKSEKKIEIVESEPQIEQQDVEELVKPSEEDFTLDPELQKAGLHIIDANDLDPRHNIKLPIDDTEILEGLDKPVNSSWRWLAEFATFLLKQAHISIKKIHGHVVRVIKK